MSTDRPATTDQQPAVYGATQPARLVITETVAASRTQGDGPWTTAEAILEALKQAGYRIFRPVDESLDVWGDERPPLDRAGYTVAARAPEAPGDDGSPTPDVGAAQGGEGGSAAESEPRYIVETNHCGQWLHGLEFDDLTEARDYAEYCHATYGDTRIVRVTREVIQ